MDDLISGEGAETAEPSSRTFWDVYWETDPATATGKANAPLIRGPLKHKSEHFEYVLPVFKFLSKEHSEKLLLTGNVHLPTLYEFRDPSRYRGTIRDEREGLVSIKNIYTKYDGLAKNADGLIPELVQPYHRVSGEDIILSIRRESPNSLIYCCSRFVFSDSLKWAIGEGKTDCVAITDFDAFTDEITAKLTGFNFICRQQCLYVGRDIVEIDPGPESTTNFLLSHPEATAFVKPKEFREQREVRVVWTPRQRAALTPVTFDLESIKKLLIPVEIRGILPEHFDCSTDLCLGVKVHLSSSSEPMQFVMHTPFGHSSPVIYRIENGPWELGFINSEMTNTVSNVDVRGPVDRPFVFTPFGVVNFCVLLTDVTKLEFVCKSFDQMFADD